MTRCREPIQLSKIVPAITPVIILLTAFISGCSTVSKPPESALPEQQLPEPHIPVQPSAPLPPSSPASAPSTIEANECRYEWVTGIAEIIQSTPTKAQLTFYPGEFNFTVDLDVIAPYLKSSTSEIKARLKRPLNASCGKAEISFHNVVE